MENHSYSSHPNSRDSSPHSGDTNENNHHSFDEQPPPPPPSSYRVKLMCSYGGKIQPRPHDHHLSYIGGDTKILAVDRKISFSSVMSKLSSLANSSDLILKYQLPGEDLDALISVTNDEDLDHMMVEYDRLCRSSPRPARLRLFLFPLKNHHSPNSTINHAPPESKPERQWFLDALNSVQAPPPPEGSSPPPLPPANPDFLFGLDNAYPAESAPTVPDFAAKDSVAGSECGSETVRELEIQELQRLQLNNGNNNNEQQWKIDEENCYTQKNFESVVPLVATHATPAQVHSGPVPVQVSGPVSVQGSFMPEMHDPRGGGYSFAVHGNGTEPSPVYLIQTPSGMFQAVRAVTGPIGQPVYFIPTPGSQLPQPQHKVANYNGGGNSEAGGVVSERGYSHVAAYLPDRPAAAPGGDVWN